MSERDSSTKMRCQRANRLELALLWAEAEAEFRSEFGGDFLRFQEFVDMEAERLIREACE